MSTQADLARRHHHDPEHLLALFIAGDENAQRTFYCAEHPRLLAIARVAPPGEAEDAAQDAWHDICRAMHSFDPSRRSSPYTSFRAWSSKLALHAAYRRWRRYRVLDSLDAADSSDRGEWEGVFTDRMQIKELHDFVQSDPINQHIFRMRLAQMSHHEIAKTLDMPVGTIRSRWSRSIAAMRSRFRHEDRHFEPSSQ